MPQQTNRTRQQLDYNRFEGRELLAGITFNEAIGEVLIGGTNENDSASVTQNGDVITVTQSGFATRQFAASEVTNIHFVGLFGDDFFQNFTSIPSFVFGGSGNDTLIGGSGNDRLVGNAGEDLLIGNEGDDGLVAGVGVDEVFGGTGDDLILGVAGANILDGGDGDDSIFGGLDGERIFGGNGDDVLAGWLGNDQIVGGNGSDLIFGGDGDDLAFGNTGDDFIFGQNGDDTLVGSAGNDVINGNNGNDRLAGQFGDDRLVGGPGQDQALFSGSARDHVVQVSGGRFDVTDLRGADFGGDDVTFGVEEHSFAEGIFPPNGLAPRPTPTTPDPTTPDPDPTTPTPGQTIIVQPIIAANSDGTNVAEYFGNAEQQADVFERIDEIFAQAGVDVEFLDSERWNDTFINVGTGTGERTTADLNTIVQSGDAAGFGNTDPNVIDLYFVERVPGFEEVSEFTANGLAFVGGNGIAAQTGDNLVSTAGGRDVIARVIAHEIGHNLGLSHEPGTNNLLSSSGSSSDLNQAQIDTILASTFTQDTANIGTQPTSISARAELTIGDDSSGSGCGCGGVGCVACGGSILIS